MSIDRIIPRSLNTDDDYLVVQATEMIDALNITIASDEDGDAGVIKIAYGNTKISFTSGNNLPSGTNKVVGSCMNKEKGEILFAVYNSSNNHSIYWHNIVTGQLRLVFRDAVLGFTADGWIKMDTLIKENNDTLLYFNDTLSDPKKINVTRALNKSVNGYPYTSLSYLDVFNQPQVYDYSAEEKLLSLTVAKQPPLDPPVVRFVQDDSFDKNNLFDTYFQFACQYVYEDGEVSALSPYSVIPISPSQLIDKVFSTSSTIEFNAIDITFKRSLGDVKYIRVLARMAGINNFFLVKEVENVRSFFNRLDTFRFYNNQVSEYIQERDSRKLFDSVPLKSNAQSLTSSRIIYGGNSEFYDNLPINADVDFEYTLRSSSAITITPSVLSTDVHDPLLSNGFQFQIDISGLPASSASPLDLLMDFRANGTNRVQQPYTISGTTYSHFVINPFNMNVRKPIYISSYSNRAQLADIIKNSIIGDYNSSANKNRFFVGSEFFELNGTYVCNIFFDSYSSNILTLRFFVKKVNVKITRDTGGEAVVSTDVFDKEQNLTFYKFTNESAITNTSLYNGFKSNQLHDVGIVYYDSRNRSGAVNRIGSFSPTIKPDGSSGINVRIKNNAPSWAKKWQLVYAPYSSYSFSYMYSVAEAFTSQESAPNAGRPIYLSLRHLEGKESSYKEAKGAIFDYSFVKGDRLRVISRYLTTSRAAELDNIDFEIIGLESFSEDDSKVFPVPTGAGSTERKTGFFLSLKDEEYIGWSANDIQAGISKWNDNVVFEIYRPAISSENKLYHEIGEVYDVVFDGTNYRHGGQRDYRYSPNFSLTQNRLSVSTLPLIGIGLATTGLDIRSGDVINVITSESPLVIQTITITYIYVSNGVKYFYTSLPSGTFRVDSISNLSDSIVTTYNGDCYFRVREIKMNNLTGTPARPTPSDLSVYYERLYIEDTSISDFNRSNFISIGRSNAISKDIKNVFRKASINWSDPYLLESSLLGLSSFNASDANFLDLQAEHGEIKYIHSNSDSIVVLQENKCSVLPVSRNVIEYLDGGAGVTVSNAFIGQQSFYAGDFGVGDFPESFASYYGKLFFADNRNGKVIRISGDGIELISEQGMDAFFQNLFEEVNRRGPQNFKVYGGIDPRNKEYIISIQKISGSFDFENQTVGYDIDNKVWASRYSFMPETMTEINGEMYSFKAGEAYAHTVDSTPRTYYGTAYPSKVSVVSAQNKSMVKSFEAVGLESSKPWSFKCSTRTQATSNVLFSNMTKKEDMFYHEIPTDNNSLPIQMIGTVQTVGGAIGGLTVSVDSNINMLPIEFGSPIFKLVSGSLVATSYTAADITNFKTLTIAGTGAVLVGDVLVARQSGSINGDKLRGNYMLIELEVPTSHTDIQDMELFAINTWFTRNSIHNDLVN
jgi:hypothetical protein